MTDHITKRPTSAPQSKLELLVDESGNIPHALLVNRGHLPIVSSQNASNTATSDSRKNSATQRVSLKMPRQDSAKSSG